nr:T9SS type A sorting domain-containing protein [uncultured Dyadobacter sp.]
MKYKLLLLLAFIALGGSLSFGQCVEDNFAFSSQADIDAFPTSHPGCSELTGYVSIIGADITNLNGLSGIKRITGNFVIYANNLLTNVDGLGALEFVEGIVDITSNPLLTNLDGLNKLTIVDGTVTIRDNVALTDISGLKSIKPSFGPYRLLTVAIIDNPNLSVCNLPNFCSHFARPGYEPIISGNLGNCLNAAAVATACAVACPSGDFNFYTQADVDAFGSTYAHCPNITLGNVTINGNNITNLDGLSNVRNIGGNLNMGNNPLLADLDGLTNLSSIGGNLLLVDNPAMTNLDGFASLAEIGGDVFLLGNASCTNFDGLSALLSIGGNLLITNNTSLTDISGLQNLDPSTIGGVAGLGIAGNPKLSVCNMPNFCEYLSDASRPRTISDNLGNCFDDTALTAACALACPWGNFTFSSQSDLDEFATRYSHCTDIILNNVTISGSDITSLSSLSNVTTINGNLTIRDNAALGQLTGLGSVASVGGALVIERNALLKTLNGLNSLAGIGGNLYVSNNSSLINLTGLGALANVSGKVTVLENPRLTSITALAIVDFGAIDGLEITDNMILSFCNLPGICSYLASNPLTHPRNISGNNGACQSDVYLIQACTSPCPTTDVVFSAQADVDWFATTYTGCTNVSLNSIVINGPDISDLSGLSFITESRSRIDILENTALTNLSGLQNIKNTGYELRIISNPALTNLDGLSSLTGVDGNLEIKENTLLTNLNGLSNLTSIHGLFDIRDNPQLTNISGMRNIAPGTIVAIFIVNNPLLSICSFYNFCTFLANSPETHPRYVYGNKGNCETDAVLEQVCQVTLPITLVSFNATNEGRINVLNWHTATEDPGDLFEIEHSVDGRKFYQIGITRALGVADSRYTFMHENPVAGLNYYRFRFVNIDGTRMYSKIAGVLVKEGGFAMNAYPNPFTGNVQVSIGKVSKNAVITVSDVSGRILQSEAVNGPIHTMSLQHLRSGTYFIRYRDNAISETIKMVK